MNQSYIRPRYLKVKEKKKSRVDIADVTALMFAGYMLGGSTSETYLYVSFFLFAVWLISVLALSPHRFLMVFRDKKVLCFLIYFVFIAVSGFSTAGTLYTAKKMGAAVLLFSPILFYNYFSKTSDTKKRSLALGIMLAAWLFVCGKALLFYESYQHAARTLASHTDAYGNVSIGGGYSLAYGCAILAVLMLGLFVTNRIRGKWRKLTAAAVILLGAVVVLQTESAVTIVCFALGILICLFFKPAASIGEPRKLALRHLLRFMLFAAFALLLIAGIKPIGEWIAELTEQSTDIVSIRLHSLGAVLAGESNEGAYALSRLTVPLKSLRTFLANPIFGVAYQHGNGFLNSGYYGIGNHCEWADALGNYGLIGGIPFLLMYVLQVREVLKSNFKVSPAWWLVLLMMGTFNPFQSFQSNLAVFFFTPAIVGAIGERRKKHMANKGEPAIEPANGNKEEYKDASVCRSLDISQ